MRYVTLAVLGLMLSLPTLGQAQNLVSNPGFETGDFTDWTVSGPITSVDASAGIGNSFAASFGAQMPDVDDLSQTLNTMAGQQYTLSFFAQTPEFGVPNSGADNSLSVFFDGNLVGGPLTVPNDPGFQQYTFTVTASTASTTLRFLASNEPDFTQLDDISVIALGGPPPPPPPPGTPEPGSLALFVGLGLTGAGVIARRRMRNRSKA